MTNLVVFSTLSRFSYKPFGFNAILCCKNAVVPWMKGGFWTGLSMKRGVFMDERGFWTGLSMKRGIFMDE